VFEYGPGGGGWGGDDARARIHKLTILLRFLGTILRILRLEVSVYNVYITNQYQTTFAGGVKSVSTGDWRKTL